MKPLHLPIYLCVIGSVFAAEDQKAPGAAGSPSGPPSLSPTPADAPKPSVEEVKKSIKKISETEYELGVMRLNAKEKTLRLPATLNMVKGPLEYLLVSENGAAHEALFVTKVTPFEMNVALLLLGFKPCETFFTKATPEKYPEPIKNPEINAESRIEYWVEWTGEAGAVAKVRAESWIFNTKTEKLVSDGPWVYNGSFIKEGDLAAQLSGNIASLYLDGIALMNNPREGNEFDDIWEPAPKLPKKGTAVTLELRLAPAGAVKETAPKRNADSKPAKNAAPLPSKTKEFK